MAARLPASFIGSFLARSTSRQTCRFTPNTTRWSQQLSGKPIRAYSSDAAPAPAPLYAKLKGDLKVAMRAKDAPRLVVLRAVLAAVLNASKTSQPIETDAQLVALLRKTARTSQEAADQFRAAGRGDLVEKEEAQIRVLEEYVAGSGVQAVDEAELKDMVQAVQSELAAEGVDAKMGEVMKKLLGPGGRLDGKDVEKTLVARIVKEVMGTKA
ncbi:Yqey-like protein-domain-containing protein [Neurospora hispaniola]|uniref:Altered inheritance of mitochondria protein 41 n=1 Tax=Neurospora hispaniola TaxID=588809 RepID=A0AAJ0HZP6_9PEZI|nr:Yqey-like protein-domain-containing protein [Neurospora hispaniola]